MVVLAARSPAGPPAMVHGTRRSGISPKRTCRLPDMLLRRIPGRAAEPPELPPYEETPPIRAELEGFSSRRSG